MNDFWKLTIVAVLVSVIIIGGLYLIVKSVYSDEKNMYEELKEKGFDVRMLENRCYINISNDIQYCTNTYSNELKKDLFLGGGEN